MILPQKKKKGGEEEGKCISGNWTVLKTYEYLKEKKMKWARKVVWMVICFKKIIKKEKRKERRLALVKRWVYAHQRPKILLKCLCSISSFVLLNCEFLLFKTKHTILA